MNVHQMFGRVLTSISFSMRGKTKFYSLHATHQEQVSILQAIFFNFVCRMLEFDWLSLSLDANKEAISHVNVLSLSDLFFVLSFVLCYLLNNLELCFYSFLVLFVYRK